MNILMNLTIEFGSGKGDNTSTDPFEVSKAENVLSGC